MAKQTTLSRMENWLQTLEEHLEAGDLSSAREADVALHKARHGAAISKTAEHRLAIAHRKLRELRDWQHWANNKKRHSLCKNLEQLPEAGLHADAVLQTLREAQAEWKHLEESETLADEHGAYRASGPGLWRRFRVASNRAYNQARPFLEKRSGLRDQNLDVVRELINRLEADLAKQEPSPVHVLIRELGQSRQVLERLDELPPKQRSAIAKRLRPIMAQLKNRVRQQEDQILKVKQALIEDAKALAEMSDSAAAISDAKRINQQWKRAGHVKNNRERQLWKELRQHLDPLFERQDSERQEQQAADESERESLRDLCVQAEQVAMRAADDLENAAYEMKSLAGQWRGTKAQDRELRNRFKKAQDELQARLNQRQAANHFSAVRLLYEKTVQNQTAKDVDETTLEQNRIAVECLCVEMELVANVDSPADAQAVRMELKVKRLNDALRGDVQGEDSEAQLQRLLKRWMELQYLPDETAAQSQARVKRCVETFYGLALNE